MTQSSRGGHVLKSFRFFCPDRLLHQLWQDSPCITNSMADTSGSSAFLSQHLHMLHALHLLTPNALFTKLVQAKGDEHLPRICFPILLHLNQFLWTSLQEIFSDHCLVGSVANLLRMNMYYFIGMNLRSVLSLKARSDSQSFVNANAILQILCSSERTRSRKWSANTKKRQGKKMIRTLIVAFLTNTVVSNPVLVSYRLRILPSRSVRMTMAILRRRTLVGTLTTTPCAGNVLGSYFFCLMWPWVSWPLMSTPTSVLALDRLFWDNQHFIRFLSSGLDSGVKRGCSREYLKKCPDK